MVQARCKSLPVLESSRPLPTGRTTATILDAEVKSNTKSSLYVLVRDAWVIDKWFKGRTGALFRIHYAGK